MRRRQERMWNKVLLLKQDISHHQGQGNFAAHVQSSLVLVRRCNELVLEVLYGTSSPWDGAILSGLQSVPHSVGSDDLRSRGNEGYASPTQFALKLIKVAEIEMELEPLASVLAGGEGIPQRQAGGKTGGASSPLHDPPVSSSNVAFNLSSVGHRSSELCGNTVVGGSRTGAHPPELPDGTSLLKRWPVISTYSSKALIAYYSGKPRQALMCSNAAVEALCAASPSGPSSLIHIALSETHSRQIAEQIVGMTASHAVIQHSLGLDREALPFAELAVLLAKNLEDCLHGAATAQLAAASRDLSHPSLLEDRGSVNTLLCICLINAAMVTRSVVIPAENISKKKVNLNPVDPKNRFRSPNPKPPTAEELEVAFATTKRYLLNAKQLLGLQSSAAGVQADSPHVTKVEDAIEGRGGLLALARVVDHEWWRTQKVFLPAVQKPVNMVSRGINRLLQRDALGVEDISGGFRGRLDAQLRRKVNIPSLTALREAHGLIRSEKARLSLRNGHPAPIRRVVTLGSGAVYQSGDDHWLSDLGL